MVYFAKWLKRGTLNQIRGKGGGLGQICPLLPPPSTLETGEAAQGVGGARPAALGLGNGRRSGEKGKGDVGGRSPLLI